MLERFRQAKEAEITMLAGLRSTNRMPEPYSKQRLSFTGSLKSGNRTPVIAEYKRASPSRGDIDLHTSPEDAAAAYAAAGAGAISVLTEERYFKGDISFLKRAASAGIPLLRKDFILHPLQMEQTAATPASAVLLIARMLQDGALQQLTEQSVAYGLEAVVEVFDLDDLVSARKANAAIIQVNNRDLETLKVNIDVSRTLVREKDGSEFWITASGIETPEELEELLSAGFDAALVGSSLMREGNQEQALRSLLKQLAQ